MSKLNILNKKIGLMVNLVDRMIASSNTNFTTPSDLVGTERSTEIGTLDCSRRILMFLWHSAKEHGFKAAADPKYVTPL